MECNEKGQKSLSLKGSEISEVKMEFNGKFLRYTVQQSKLLW